MKIFISKKKTWLFQVLFFILHHFQCWIVSQCLVWSSSIVFIDDLNQMAVSKISYLINIVPFNLSPQSSVEHFILSGSQEIENCKNLSWDIGQGEAEARTPWHKSHPVNAHSENIGTFVPSHHIILKKYNENVLDMCVYVFSPLIGKKCREHLFSAIYDS